MYSSVVFEITEKQLVEHCTPGKWSACHIHGSSVEDMLLVQLYTQCKTIMIPEPYQELGDHGLIKDSASTICWTGGSCTPAKASTMLNMH